MTPRAPEVWSAGAVTARRLCASDLPFVGALMADPALHRHNPSLLPPDPAQVTEDFSRDLAHWERHGFGR